MASTETGEGLSSLDNPVWQALNTQQARFAEGTSLAKRYTPQVTLYAAVVDYGEAALDDLARIVAKGQTIRLFESRKPPELPGWTLERAYTIQQMVCDQPVEEPKSNAQIIDLTEADVPDMLRLTGITLPCPFFPRTIEMGHYIGIRHEGQLIAMAGERFHLPGYRELSAICTAPGHQGKGYARLLTSRLVNENWGRGTVPFLHVSAENKAAYHLYESLHFQWRAELHVTVLTR